MPNHPAPTPSRAARRLPHALLLLLELALLASILVNAVLIAFVLK